MAQPEEAPLKFLRTSETADALNKLIDSAAEKLWLVSPYVRLGKLRGLGRRIEGALRRKVVVSLVFRSNDASTSKWSSDDMSEVERLVGAGLQLFEVPDLHTKLYLTEKQALVTSLNLLESSFNNSIEIGLIIPNSRPEYAQLRDYLRTEIGPVNRPARVDPIAARNKDRGSDGAKSFATPKADEAHAEGEGFCIAGRDRIPYDGRYPFCRKHFEEWRDRSEDEDEPANYCHDCGKARKVSKAEPFCRSCDS